MVAADFKETLADAIERSGLTLRELAARCQTKGARVTYSYLSKLRSGAAPPPSDKVARVLAEELGLDPDEFALQAYVSRVPEHLRSRLMEARKPEETPMLTFAQLLREYIGERTLESVVAECKARGVDIDRLYLGRLRSGNRLPPEDDNVTRTIALVCGRDPEPLILLATMERHPERVFAAIFEALGVTDGDRSCLASLSEFARRVAALPPVPAPSVEPAAQALRDIIRTANDALAKLKAQTTDAPA